MLFALTAVVRLSHFNIRYWSVSTYPLGDWSLLNLGVVPFGLKPGALTSPGYNGAASQSDIVENAALGYKLMSADVTAA